MKILLLSAYEAYSHRYWREVLCSYFEDFQWTCLCMPPRHFNWRIRGSSLNWAQTKHHILSQRYDICLATSMVDLATLRGLIPALWQTPTVLYFHENQFAYPLSREHHAKIKITEALMVQLYSSLAADRLCFNSEYNCSTLLGGVRDFLNKLPDFVPPQISEQLALKSEVIHVPLKPLVSQNTVSKDPNSFIWNHRWEHDKGPRRLLALLRALPENLPLTLHVVGQSFRQVPSEFDLIRQELAQRGWLGQWGYIEDETAYFNLLERTQYVLSTSEHDFQGLAILEAVARGCLPILPDRLAYREIFDARHRYTCEGNIDLEAGHMVCKILEFIKSPVKIPCPDISQFCLDNVGSQYRSLFRRLAGGGNGQHDTF